MRKCRTYLTILLLLSFTVTALTACGPIQQASDALQSAIDELAQDPGNVKAILDDTIIKLDQLSGSTIKEAAAAVRGLLGDVNALAQCELDSIGIHAEDALVYIQQHILLKKTPPPPTPWVCLTNPTTIDVTQNSSGGPYTLTSSPEYQLFGFNYRYQTLPRINYYRSDGKLATANVVAAGLHTPYEIDINLQTVDFSGAQPGDYFSVDWSNSVTGSNRIDLVLSPYQAPPPFPTRIEYFVVSVHANSGLFSGSCTDIALDPLSEFTIGSPWKVNRAQGDPGHPGVHEAYNHDNQQANNTLRGYNYQPLNDNQVKVTGTVCGSNNDGAGAIFERQYAVYEVCLSRDPAVCGI